VQLSHKEAAAVHTAALDAKDAGNRHFQSGDNALALACYERCVELIPKESSDLKAVAYSNMAAVYLKLQYYKEADEVCTAAIEAAGPREPPPKALYRRALAREGLGPTHLQASITDLRRAMAAVTEAGQSGEVKKLQGDLQRLETAAGHRQKLKTEEAQASALRGTGSALPAKTDKVAAPPSKDGYVKETDYSFTAKKRLKEVVAGIYTSSKECRVNVKDMMEPQTKISVSVLSKGGKRSLYYDFDILYEWEGRSKKGRKDEASFGGVIRLYNIGQDTKFELGGLPETSWMYSLGFRADAHAQGEPWLEEIKATANDLFEPLALRIGQVIKELHQY